MRTDSLSIADLLGLIPADGHPWIYIGALAHEESLKSGCDLVCPYADATEESEYWHMGYIGAQILQSHLESAL